MQSLNYDGADRFRIDNSDCLGYQLLKLRMNAAVEREADISSQCQLRSKVKEDIESLLREAGSRSTNMSETQLENLKKTNTSDSNVAVQSNSKEQSHWVRRSVRKSVPEPSAASL